MALNLKNPFVEWMIGCVQHYHKERYWNMRAKVVSCRRDNSLIINVIQGVSLCRLYLIKQSDAFNNASLGTNLGFGAHFEDIPHFPHGLYVIIVSPYAQIGKNVRIFQ